MARAGGGMTTLEYPHCKNCSEYRRCKEKGYNVYKTKYLKFAEKCTECTYDFKCTHDCPDYYELCLNEMILLKDDLKKICICWKETE